MATDLGFGEVSSDPIPEHQRYAGRLVIPHRSARGGVVAVGLRDMTGTDDRKYLYPAGFDLRLYGLDQIGKAGHEIHLTEGQLDGATLIACGLHAVGIPGAQAWRPYHFRLFAGFDRVFFWADQDDKGASMGLFERIRLTIPQVGLMMLPNAEDCNSFFVKAGREGILSLLDSGSSEPEETEDDGDIDPPF